jgi:hypothetical protein
VPKSKIVTMQLPNIMYDYFLNHELGLRMLSWDVDLRIEPHSFARTDFDETDPFVREIIATGERIL